MIIIKLMLILIIQPDWSTVQHNIAICTQSGKKSWRMVTENRLSLTKGRVLFLVMATSSVAEEHPQPITATMFGWSATSLLKHSTAFFLLH